MAEKLLLSSNKNAFSRHFYSTEASLIFNQFIQLDSLLFPLSVAFYSKANLHLHFGRFSPSFRLFFELLRCDASTAFRVQSAAMSKILTKRHLTPTTSSPFAMLKKLFFFVALWREPSVKYMPGDKFAFVPPTLSSTAVGRNIRRGDRNLKPQDGIK